MDLAAYRAAYFVDSPPAPRYAFTGAFGATLYVAALPDPAAGDRAR